MSQFETPPPTVPRVPPNAPQRGVPRDLFSPIRRTAARNTYGVSPVPQASMPLVAPLAESNGYAMMRITETIEGIANLKKELDNVEQMANSYWEDPLQRDANIAFTLAKARSKIQSLVHQVNSIEGIFNLDPERLLPSSTVFSQYTQIYIQVPDPSNANEI